MLKLYRFHAEKTEDTGIVGIFISTEEETQKIIGKNIRVEDEIFTLQESHIIPIDINSDYLEITAALTGYTISGINPHEYIEQKETNND